MRRHLKAGRDVRRFLVGSQFMKNELEMNGVQDHKIEIVHPVPASLQAPAALPMGEAPELLFVGQVIRGKGVDLMLQALARINGNWHATIVGDGNHIEACRHLARRLAIHDRIRFRGWVNHDELDRYYTAARLVVVPSRWPEPFGMVGIEAMARGRPVVAFDTGGIPDWLDDGVTGLLVPAANVAMMASAIQRLLDDSALASRMGRAGSARVQNSFSHQAYLDQIRCHLESLK